MGPIVTKLLTIAEIIKYRVNGLYQINEIGSEIIEDVYEPLEEGLDTLIFKRIIPTFKVTLKIEEPENKDHYGF